MLRLIFGETIRERMQEEELQRLRAELSDIRATLAREREAQTLALQDAYKRFIDFLRPPQTAQGTAPQPPQKEWPGERPDTSPPYPDVPPWARGEIPTAPRS